jgi:cell wall-associated NlpC family hydrolase
MSKQHLVLAAIGALLVGLLTAAALALGGGDGGNATKRPAAPRPGGEEIVLGGEGKSAGPSAAERKAAQRASRAARRSHAKSVRFAGVSDDGVWVDPEASRRPPPKPPSDDEVRAELREFRRYLASAGGLVGPRAKVLPDGRAVAPRGAPDVVKQVIQAANAIADTPYKWGGGHAGWEDTGYDCSGSISFALAGAGLLGSPLASGGFMRWASPGEGRWITIYANGGHAFMVVAGLRFDTSGRSQNGTRWQASPRSTAGFEPRHPAGL